MDLKNLNAEQIKKLRSDKAAALKALFALTSPTPEQVQEARGLGSDLDEIDAEMAERTSAAKKDADDFAALQSRFAKDDEGEGEDQAAKADEEVDTGE